MRTRSTGLTFATPFIAGIFLLLPSIGAGQDYTPPRTSDGQPDLQGVWQALNTANWNIQDHTSEYGVPRRHPVTNRRAVRAFRDRPAIRGAATPPVPCRSVYDWMHSAEYDRMAAAKPDLVPALLPSQAMTVWRPVVEGALS